MTPNPELAESWETSKDGLIWTFKLRQGREVPRRPGADLRGREVHLRPPLREVPGQSPDFIAVDKVEPAGKYAVEVS